MKKKYFIIKKKKLQQEIDVKSQLIAYKKIKSRSSGNYSICSTSRVFLMHPDDSEEVEIEKNLFFSIKFSLPIKLNC